MVRYGSSHLGSGRAAAAFRRQRPLVQWPGYGCAASLRVQGASESFLKESQSVSCQDIWNCLFDCLKIHQFKWTDEESEDGTLPFSLIPPFFAKSAKSGGLRTGSGLGRWSRQKGLRLFVSQKKLVRLSKQTRCIRMFFLTVFFFFACVFFEWCLTV